MTRRGWAIATVSVASLFGASFTAVAVFDPLPRVVWNASASAPIGFYRINPLPDPPLGALVAGAVTGTRSRMVSVDSVAG